MQSREQLSIAIGEANAKIRPANVDANDIRVGVVNGHRWDLANNLSLITKTRQSEQFEPTR